MKKLLLAPFLLASLFSFSGELKAYPKANDSDFQSRSKEKLSNKNHAYFFPYIHVKERFKYKENDNWITSIEGNGIFITKAIPFNNIDDCTRFGQQWNLTKKTILNSVTSNKFYKPIVHTECKGIY